MKNLIKVEPPKIIECYNFEDWKVTIVEKQNILDEIEYEFYLTGNTLTIYMFGVLKDILKTTGQTLEELVINTLPDYISIFKNEFEE